jgi:hypothetical protein
MASDRNIIEKKLKEIVSLDEFDSKLKQGIGYICLKSKMGLTALDFVKNHVNPAIWDKCIKNDIVFVNEMANNFGVVDNSNSEGGMSPGELTAYAKEALDDKFLLAATGGRQLSFYPIVDNKLKIVGNPIERSEFNILAGQMITTRLFEVIGDVPAPSIVDTAIKCWINTSENLNKIHVSLGVGELPNDWCFFRKTRYPYPGPTPHWDTILERLTDGDTLAAWIYGVYSGRYKGRQAMWITGTNGEDGKSVIGRALSILFGPAYGSINNNQIKGSSNFTNAAFHEKEIVVYPDANNTMIFKTETFKSITGNDSVPIEFKGKMPFTAKLSSKILVFSNIDPYSDGLNMTDSRFLFMRIASRESDAKVIFDFENNLIAEFDHFLYKGMVAYRNLCPDDYKFLESDALKVLKTSVSSESMSEYEDFIEEYLVEDPDGYILSKDLTDLMKGIRWDEHERSSFKRWMTYVGRMSKEVRVKDEFGHSQRVFKGIRTKGKKGDLSIIKSSFKSNNNAGGDEESSWTDL